ncbi:hypothetical protein DY000_02030233 [Brassica cretica]|uniref:RNase H type-1 domain-containing protein n=1 Tax=Brassica cretica TaxID=69181 RepID=A0ABQ7DNU4_BRACR|nr:hypothetical protein DY000_02030233 [Brassica cretica]
MLPVMEETGIDIEQSDGHAETVAPAIPRWRCQVDASWVSTQEAVGVGFVMMEEGATILYGDCQQLVKLIKNDEEEWPAMATELNEIKALASNFNIFSISYVSRSLNLRADGLAKGVRSRELRIPYVN